MAKDMGKNQQMNQNVQAENLQTQNPNFQSSISSNSDSMSANDNFRPVQGDPDAPSGTRFSTTDPHGRPVQGDPDAPSGTRFSTTDPHGRPVQGDPDAPSGTRFSTTDPHGRPVQGDPDAPSGTRFSTSDPHGRPVQGDPNAPAGPRANIDSMDAMGSMGMDEAASAAQGSQKMGNDANARGKGGGGMAGIVDSPSEVTQVGTAGADVWEVLKGGLQNRYTPEEYKQLLDDAWKRFGATLARTPYDAMKGISNVFFASGYALTVLATNGAADDATKEYLEQWGNLWRVNEDFFDGLGQDAYDNSMGHGEENGPYANNYVPNASNPGEEANAVATPDNLPTGIVTDNDTDNSGRGMDPAGPGGQNEFANKVIGWLSSTGQMPSLGGNPHGHGKSSQQQRLEASLAYTAASVFERGENDFKFNNGLMDVEIDQGRLDQLTEQLGNERIDTGDPYGHGPSDSIKDNFDKLEESLNDKMDGAHDLGGRGSGSKVDGDMADRLEEVFDDRLDPDDKFDNRHDFDHRVDIEDFRPGLSEKPEFRPDFRPDLDNRPPVFDPNLDNKPDFNPQPIVDEKPIAPDNPDAPDSSDESAPAGDGPEGTGIWSGPHFKDPPPEDTPEAPPADSAEQADGSGVAVKPRPGKRPRWPIFAAGGAAIAVIAGVVLGGGSKEPVTPKDPAACQHTWAVVETVETKCETDGYVISVCGDCGEEQREDTKAAGHQWEETEVVEVTCETDGKTVLTCSVCGETKTEETKAEGHQWEITEDIEVTCETEGKVEQTCSVCGETKTEEAGALGHQWEETEHTDATCTTSGKTVTTCSVCGATETEESEATGHSWQKEFTVAQSCKQQGYTYYTCANCGEHKSDNWTDFGAHVWVSDAKAATCTAAGSDHQHCSVCGAETGGTIAALGHNYVSGVCTRCGDRIVIEAPDYGDDWNDPDYPNGYPGDEWYDPDDYPNGYPGNDDGGFDVIIPPGFDTNRPFN